MTPQDLIDIAEHFNSIELPKTLRYNEATYFNDLPKAIKNDIFTLETYGYTHTFAASWERLVTIKKLLEEGKGGE